MKTINFNYSVMLVVQKCTVTAEKNDNKAILLSFLSKQPVCAYTKDKLYYDMHEWTGILHYTQLNAMCKFYEQSHDVSSGQVELECLCS